MRFVHLSDTHLGYRQYGLFQRENDFYQNFDNIVEKIIELNPDFVIHSGDLFEFSRAPPRALLQVQKNLKKLRDKKITVYAIPGNHDTVTRQFAQPPHVLYQDYGLKMPTLNEPDFIHKGIFIGGIRYFPKYYRENLILKIEEITKKAMNFDKRIIILHQAVDKFLGYNYELEMGDLPKEFDYYAMGHIHKRIITDYGRGKFAYSGSTDIWSKDEYSNYEQKGKGFYLVDLDSDIPDVQPITLKLPREIIKADISEDSIESDIQALTDIIGNKHNKPVVYLDIHSIGLNIDSIYSKIQKKIAPYSLTVRPNFILKTSDEREKLPSDLISIHEFIREYCNTRKELKEISKQFKTPEFFVEKVVQLYNSLTVDDIKAAIKISEELYGGLK